MFKAIHQFRKLNNRQVSIKEIGIENHNDKQILYFICTIFILYIAYFCNSNYFILKKESNYILFTLEYNRV